MISLSPPQQARNCFVLKPFRAPESPTCPVLRVFAFPFAGGSVTSLRGLLEGLPSCFEVIGVELPGRGLLASSPLCWNLDDLLTHLAVSIGPLVTSNTLFIGYSFGGLLASELIRHLQAQRLTLPAGLACFSSKAPRLVAQDQPWAELSEGELIQRLQKMGGISETILQSDEYLQLALPSIQADLRCYGQYVVYNDLPLECPVLGFWGVQDPFLRSPHIDAWFEEVAQRQRPQTSIRVLEGGHFCHVGNEVAIQSVLTDWVRALGLLPEGLPVARHEARRFVWNPFLSGDHS